MFDLVSSVPSCISILVHPYHTIDCKYHFFLVNWVDVWSHLVVGFSTLFRLRWFAYGVR